MKFLLEMEMEKSQTWQTVDKFYWQNVPQKSVNFNCQKNDQRKSFVNSFCNFVQLITSNIVNKTFFAPFFFYQSPVPNCML